MIRRAIDGVPSARPEEGAKILPFNGAVGTVGRIARAREEAELYSEALLEAVGLVLTSLIGASREQDGRWSFQGCRIFVQGQECIVYNFPYFQYGAEFDEAQLGGHRHVASLMREVPEIRIIAAHSDDNMIVFSLPVNLVDAGLLKNDGGIHLEVVGISREPRKVLDIVEGVNNNGDLPDAG